MDKMNEQCPKCEQPLFNCLCDFYKMESKIVTLEAEVGRLMDENSTLGVLLHNQRVELTELRAENKRLKQAITDHENDCAVLPEDRSVTEYVNELLAQLEAARTAWPHIKDTILAGATHPVWPMVRLMDSAILQPDSWKGEG